MLNKLNVNTHFLGFIIVNSIEGKQLIRVKNNESSVN